MNRVHCLQVGKRHGLPEVIRPEARLPHNIVIEEQGDFMQFVLGKKENDTKPGVRCSGQRRDGGNDILTNKVRNEVFMSGCNVTRLPQDADLIKKGIDQIGHRSLKTVLPFKSSDDSLEAVFIEIKHGCYQRIDMNAGLMRRLT